MKRSNMTYILLLFSLFLFNESTWTRDITHPLISLTPADRQEILKPATSLRAAYMDDSDRVLSLMEFSEMEATKEQIARNDKSSMEMYNDLIRRADQALDLEPFSVMNKTGMPPSGDRHDYLSLAPYFWPNPDTPDGMPYIRKDGEINPETRDNTTDYQELKRFFNAVDLLGRANYFSEDVAYAHKAIELIQAWFIDPETRMNPHLNYGQGIPGVNDGRPFGIIEFGGIRSVITSLELLENAQLLDPNTQDGVKAWLSAYADWLQTSEIGMMEGTRTNNHGNWYDVQLSSILLYLEKKEEVAEILEAAKQKRIAQQIEPDGSQPRELERTKSFSYSTMNLSALTILAYFGLRMDVDLWNFETEDGRGIKKGYAFLIPYLDENNKWEYQQITKGSGHIDRFVNLLSRAGKTFKEETYLALANEYKANKMGARTSALPKVQRVELETIDPDEFSMEEWYMPYYLKHFSEVANSVLDTGANRGYLSLSVWRGSGNNHPYNARIMEGIMSLVWFYTSERTWNPYFNDPALKARIEAALSFWCKMQNEDGKFSEYGTDKWTLAPTAFATKFIGRALWLLETGPGIDEAVFEQARISLRKAILIGFSDEALWDHGKSYTNQYANLWGGALMYLDVWPDAEIEILFRKRFDQSMSDFQSPAGYFYEAGGPDFKYNLSTHHSDLQVAWQYAMEKELRDKIVRKTSEWYDWFSYNALKEPGSSCYYLNRAIETRQHIAYVLSDELEDPALARWVPQAEFVPMAQAFQISQVELAYSQKEKYTAMRLAYPLVDSLEVGEFRAFSPYAFLHEGMEAWLPSEAEKEKATANLPYLKKKEFIHIRKDSRFPVSYAYVKRPSYYAVFNSGEKLTDQQRYGLGLLWNPVMGTLLQSQSRSDLAAYGTGSEGEEKVYEAGDLFPQMELNGQILEPGIGRKDFDGKDFRISYKLGESGHKEVFFEGDRLTISIEYPGKFFETLPLLKAEGDKLSWDNQQIRLEHAGNSMIIDFKNSSEIEEIIIQADLHQKECHSFRIEAKDKLEYSIYFK